MEQLNRLVCTESGKKEGNERRGKWTERKRQSLEMKEQVCGREGRRNLGGEGLRPRSRMLEMVIPQGRCG